jgi:hypothetical protein
MNEQYLWDGQGEPDPEIEKLERALSGLGHRDRALDTCSIGSINAAPTNRLLGAKADVLYARLTRAAQFRLLWGAIAASLIVGSIIGVHGYNRFKAADSGWRISWNGSQAHSVRTGQTIDTGANSIAQLNSDSVGEVQVEAGSRLRIMHSAQDAQRLALLHGTIHAFIWSPPGSFVVDTPSAKTIDLGCRYTLHIAPDGSGILQVETGWVAFQWRNLESFIPAGAECRTRPTQGPGTPHYDDAPAVLTTALIQFDETHSANALRTVLSSARSRDALTVWHLLMRTQGAERIEVFRRLRELVALPSTVTEENILRGDPSAIDSAWNALGLGNTDWWREWKRRAVF